jgi:hypothetical protein
MDELPLEILCHIFRIASHDKRPRDQLAPQYIISHVCRSWRQTALGLPCLWTSIDAVIEYDPTLEFLVYDRQIESLSRSRDHDLQVHLVLSTDRPSLSGDLLLRHIAQASYRIRRLFVDLENPEARELIVSHLDHAPFPRLQALRISEEIPTEDKRDIFLSPLPSLRYLSAPGVGHAFHQSILNNLIQAEFMSVCNVTEVPFQWFPLRTNSLRALATGSPYLKHLSIWTSTSHCHDTETLYFPKLISLRLNLGECGSNIVMIAPQLRHLVLYGRRRPTELVDFLTPIVVRPPAQRFPYVRTLHLHYFSDNQPGIGKLFTQCFGDVTDLHLGDIRTSSLFCAMSTALSDGSMPWPNLRNLAMLLPDTEDLLQLVRARAAAPLARLEMDIYAGDDPSQYDSIPQRNDIRVLRKLVDILPLPACLEGSPAEIEDACLSGEWEVEHPLRDEFPPLWFLQEIPSDEEDDETDKTDGIADTDTDETDDYE